VRGRKKRRTAKNTFTKKEASRVHEERAAGTTGGSGGGTSARGSKEKGTLSLNWDVSFFDSGSAKDIKGHKRPSEGFVAKRS